jgi:hypothetical protein
MNLLNKITKAPSAAIQKKAIIQIFQATKFLTVEQVPPQLFVELAKEGLVKEPAESMAQFMDRVIEAYKKKA